MVTRASPVDTAPLPHLKLFLTEEGDAFRAYLEPTRLPPFLAPFFDVHGEAFPVIVDLDDLAHHMAESNAGYEKSVTRTGSIELTAHGDGAMALAVWLSTALASGVRSRS